MGHMILMALMMTVIIEINNSTGHVIGKSILLQVTPRDIISFQRIHMSKSLSNMDL